MVKFEETDCGFGICALKYPRRGLRAEFRKININGIFRNRRRRKTPTIIFQRIFQPRFRSGQG